MVSSTILTARSLSSGGCRCPDPCLGVCCFGADMGSILPKNRASIKPRAVHPPPSDQNPNTIPAPRLVETGRRITAVSQFPETVRFLAIPLVEARCGLGPELN